ncbi:hypothetical protein [Dietzia sp.]|uniref:hypothetical protein n=1 Tax=Dietzia sp. TaxID=1871616 RepID=UPI002FDAE73A
MAAKVLRAETAGAANLYRGRARPPRLGFAPLGLNAGLLVADSPLDDAQLARLGLRPAGENCSVQDVLLTPADERACIVEVDGFTIDADGGDALAAAAENDSGVGGALLDRPGSVYCAFAVSSKSICDFLVVDQGEFVRHFRQEEEQTSADVGLPLKKEFLFTFSPEGEADADEPGDGERVVDGDSLIDRLTAVAGLPPSVDVFDRSVRAYASA